MTTFISTSLSSVWRSLYAIASKLVDDLRLDACRCGDVGFGTRGIAAAPPRDPATIKRRCSFRIGRERRGVVDDCLLVSAELQIDQPAAVEGIRKIRLNPQRHVAIPERIAHLVKQGQDPTTVVQRGRVVGITAKHFVEVLNSEFKVAIDSSLVPAPIEPGE